jgi:hypothetical protein
VIPESATDSQAMAHINTIKSHKTIDKESRNTSRYSLMFLGSEKYHFKILPVYNPNMQEDKKEDYESV